MPKRAAYSSAIRRSRLSVGRGLALLEPLESRLAFDAAPAAAPTSLAPSGVAQQLIYDLNLARHDPAAYAAAHKLSAVFPTTAAPPLALNDQLVASADRHALDLARNTYFDHYSTTLKEWPNQLVRDTGYALPQGVPVGDHIDTWPNDNNNVESLANGTSDPLVALDSLLVDANFNPPVHREQLLGLDEQDALDREVGVAYEASGNEQDWAIHAALSSPSQSFLTGVVFDDRNGDGLYEAGEGLGGVVITAGGATTTTNTAGGWSLPVADGTLAVTASNGASGTALGSALTVPVTVSGENVEVDFLAGKPQVDVDFVPFVDTAPTLSAAVSPLLAADAAGAVPGEAVGSIVGGGVTDPDLQPAGMALFSIDDAHGTWQFSRDGGSSWTNVPTVSTSNALLLSGTDRLHFLPAAGFVGSSRIGYAAWDLFGGTDGATVDLAALGRGSAPALISSASETASVKVTLLNTAPMLLAGYQATLPAVGNDDTNPAGQSAAALLAGNATDLESGSALGIAITGSSGSTGGTWQYSLDGSVWSNMASASPGAALLLAPDALVRFVPISSYSGSVSLTFRAWDQSSGISGSKVDLSGVASTGGATAFSLLAGSASIEVLAANHAPQLAAGAQPRFPTIAAGSTLLNQVQPLSVQALINGSMSDSDFGALQGIALIGSTGSGNWFYYANDGSQAWHATQYFLYNALLLPANYELAFVPAAGFLGQASITFVGWDRTSGGAGAAVNLSALGATGGETAFSLQSITATAWVGAASGQITGSAYVDANADGALDSGEAGLAGVLLYLDANGNGKFDAGELSTRSQTDGSFTFGGLAPGSYTVRAVTPAGYRASEPFAGKLTITLAAGGVAPGNAFGMTRLAPYQNPVQPLDVDANNLVALQDALVVVNALNANQGGALGAPTGTPSDYYDVSGDNLLSPLDALLIINQLNGETLSGSTAAWSPPTAARSAAAAPVAIPSAAPASTASAGSTAAGSTGDDNRPAFGAAERANAVLVSSAPATGHGASGAALGQPTASLAGVGPTLRGRRAPAVDGLARQGR